MSGIYPKIEIAGQNTGRFDIFKFLLPFSGGFSVTIAAGMNLDKISPDLPGGINLIRIRINEQADDNIVIMKATDSIFGFCIRAIRWNSKKCLLL